MKQEDKDGVTGRKKGGWASVYVIVMVTVLVGESQDRQRVANGRERRSLKRKK